MTFSTENVSLLYLNACNMIREVTVLLVMNLANSNKGRVFLKCSYKPFRIVKVSPNMGAGNVKMGLGSMRRVDASLECLAASYTIKMAPASSVSLLTFYYSRGNARWSAALKSKEGVA